jgi:hypothetical protein
LPGTLGFGPWKRPIARSSRPWPWTAACPTPTWPSASACRCRPCTSGCAGWSSAAVDHDALGLSLTAFVAIRPLDPSQPDDAPDRLSKLPQIESCYSVAGEDFYLLLVRVENPLALERLLQEIRSAANVTTRTTVVLSTPYEHRPNARPL